MFKMKLLFVQQSWSLVLNSISKFLYGEQGLNVQGFNVLRNKVGTYLNGSTICLFWNSNFEFQPQVFVADYASFVGIHINNLKESFDEDVVDVRPRKKQLQENNLPYDDLLLKLMISIEVTHCETFMVFGKDIARFVGAFTNASMYSIWRSLHNRFVFSHMADELNEDCYKNIFFEDQPNILFIVQTDASGTVLEMKTNKYVGTKAEKPAQLQLLDRYYVVEERFQLNNSLFPNKLKDLQGREVVIAGFDYRPYTVIKCNTENSNTRDIGVAQDSELSKVFIDGTEARVVLNFCEKFNCTVQIDTSDADDWGTVYQNMSGDGAMGMIINHKADICIGAMYSWYEGYTYLDLSMYLVRSGITCLVPAPLRLASWNLPLQPFQANLWAAVLVYLCLETLGLVLAYRSEQVLYVSASAREGWWCCAMLGLATSFKLFISQSGNSTTTSLTVRVLLFACFLNDIIITSIYGGGLASILTIPSMSEAADTVPRLRNHRLQWAANSEAWVSAIRGSDEPLVQDLLSNFHIYSDEQLLRFAQETQVRLGFTVERLPFGHFAIGDYLVPEAIDQMVIMQEDLYYQYTVAFVPRLWPLLEQFNTLIYSWHSSGFDKYWEYRVVADNLNVQKQQQVESTMLRSQEDIGPVRLGMSNFAGIILVWVLGSIVATLVFVAELFATNLKTPIDN
ncbi:uncharacterized protein LOC117891467 [Drosophila subobscura]|uniref:uncharacterized protein LOC117891467 n=1 Tax=Drosophila subobscura TaxID=7241 RepID=UPI00155B175B|nr:uncharacterized protein LOC117891467 [Drosophila subobscura]